MPLESRGLNAFGTSGARSSVGVTIFFLIISTLAVLGRFVSRKLRAATYGIDDWLMVAGLIGFYGQAATNILMTTAGGVGYHLRTLAPANIKTLFQLLTVIQFPYGLTMVLIRLSICALFIRIFVTRRFRLAVYAVMALNIAWFIFVIASAAAICIPFSYNWDKKIQGGKCGNQRTIYAVIAAWALACDGLMWALPFPIVWKLHLPTGQKTALSAIFALGIIDMIVSIFRVVYILGLDLQGDLSFLVVQVNCWSISEPGIAILVGCGPILRPLFDKMVPRRLVTRSQSAFTRASPSKANTKSKTYGKLSEDQIELTTPHNTHKAVSRATITAGDSYDTTQDIAAQAPDDARKIGVVREYTISRV